MANVVVNQSFACKDRADVAQIAKEKLVGTPVPVEPAGMLREEFSRDQIQPVQRPAGLSLQRRGRVCEDLARHLENLHWLQGAIRSRRRLAACPDAN